MIFETYGSGNITNEKWFLKALKIIIDKKIPVVNVTQCAGGSVDMNIYSTNIIYRNIGIISGKDISTEAAVTKLMFMLGQNIPANNFKTKFETSLRGEMK
jgi:L-asparaginase